MAWPNLLQRNLVDARGSLHERRYSIHSLTRTFLRGQEYSIGDRKAKVVTPVHPLK